MDLVRYLCSSKNENGGSSSNDRFDSVEPSLIQAIKLDNKAELMKETKRLAVWGDQVTASKLLRVCCKMDSPVCVSGLLNGEFGAAPGLNEFDDDSGKTPLHTAAEALAARCVYVLLKREARTDLRTKDGHARLALELSLSNPRIDLNSNITNDFSIKDLATHMGEKDLSVVKLLGDKTKEVAEVACTYAIQGREAALTALLIVAADKVNESVKKNEVIFTCLMRELSALGNGTKSERRKELLRIIEILEFFRYVFESAGPAESEDDDSRGGTTNILVQIGELLIVGCDVRLSDPRDERIVRDTRKKFEYITSTIISTMVGSEGAIGAMWQHMKSYVSNHKDELITSSKIASVGKKTPRLDGYKYSCDSFVANIEKTNTSGYHVWDIYDEETDKRKKGKKKITLPFKALGSGRRDAEEAWNEFFNGGEPTENKAYEAVIYALLQASLQDRDTGGILSVLWPGLQGILVDNYTVVDLYLRFYDRYKHLENASILLFYILPINKKQLVKKLRNSGEVVEVGHPLTKLKGRYYMNRVLYEEESSASKLLNRAQTVPHKKQPQFSSWRGLRSLTIAGKKVFLARQSEDLLRSLIASGDTLDPGPLVEF